jgi:methyltransferase (TIGR00027 family)
MNEGVRGPNPTAFGAAVHRAIHQDLEGGLILADPLAWSILGVEAPERQRILDQAREQARPSLRTFIAMRHRFADDVVAEGSLRGLDQVILLESGLDTFAYRTMRQGISVYEVDTPEMLDFKKSSMSAAGIPQPRSVHFVPVDFAADDWLVKLAEAGLSKRSVTVLWLGVVPYSSVATVQEVLAKLATLPGVEVVFDYSTREQGRNQDSSEVRDRLGNRIAALGEPFRSSWEPDEMQALLRDLGYDEIEDLGPAELADRYLRRESLRRAGGGGGHLIRARSTRWVSG